MRNMYRLFAWSRGLNCSATTTAVFWRVAGGGGRECKYVCVHVRQLMKWSQAARNLDMNYLLLSLLLQSRWKARRGTRLVFAFFKQVNILGQSKQPEFHLAKVGGGGFEVVALIDSPPPNFLTSFLLIVADWRRLMADEIPDGAAGTRQAGTPFRTYLQQLRFQTIGVISSTLFQCDNHFRGNY